MNGFVSVPRKVGGMIMAKRFCGSIPALVTPFRDGKVDFPAFERFIDWQIAEGSAGLVPCGTTGESATLSMNEHHQLIEAAVRAADGRVPVIAGAGSNDTATMVAHIEHAAACGADAVLVITPYYNKPSQEGVYGHFQRAADASDLPVFLYNVPGRTVTDIAPATVKRLAELPAIIGIKDASGNVARVTQTRLDCGEEFVQLSGADELTLGIMAAGGQGCISVTANVAPALCAAFQAACLDGRWDEARALNDRLFPLHLALFADASPGPTKYALEKLGRLTSDFRLPMTPPSEAARQAVDAALLHAGLV